MDGADKSGEREKMVGLPFCVVLILFCDLFSLPKLLHCTTHEHLKHII